MHEPFPSLLLHIVPQLMAIVTIKYELKTYLQKAQASMEHTLLRSVGRFPQNQSKEFQRVCCIFHPSQQTTLRLFSSIPYIKQHGKDFCNIYIDNESSLRIYEKVAVEVQVISIINGLRGIEQGRKQFQPGQEIFFKNNSNGLSNVAKEAQ